MVNYRITEFQMATKVLFGIGVAKEVGAETKKFDKQKVLIVTDKGVKEAGLLEKIIESLNKSNLDFVVFNETEPNASIEVVELGSKLQKKENCELLLAIGGGSSIDTAKAIGVLATNPGPLRNYEGPEKYSTPPLPIIAIPTTAGTGSEVSFGAVLLDKKRNYKMSMRSVMQAPKVALLDPKLLSTLPPHLAAATGMDALSHAIESYVSLWASPLTDALCLETIRLVGENLRCFVGNPQNLEAAGNMLIASSMAAMAFNSARVGNVHAMAHPLGAFFDMHHGIACAVMLPYVLEYNMIVTPDKLVEIAIALGESIDTNNKNDAAYKAVEGVKKLMRDIRMPQSLKDLKVNKETIQAMAKDAIQSGMHLTNPRLTKEEDIIGLFEKAFQG